jgi:hypothetical protein
MVTMTRRPRRQAESDFRARDLLQDSIGGPRGNLPHAGPLPQARREAKLPDAFAELEREQQRRASGRHCGRLLSGTASGACGAWYVCRVWMRRTRGSCTGRAKPFNSTRASDRARIPDAA